MKNIIETYKYSVQTIIKKMTGRYNEDLEQEVYIKTWKNLDKYEEQNKFKSWLNTITYNLCRDYLRLKSTKYEKSLGELDENIQNNNTFEDRLDSLNRQKRILKEINRLPKKLREVIIYHELEEKSYEEISFELNIPIGTVKSRIHNGKELLKIALKDMLRE